MDNYRIYEEAEKWAIFFLLLLVEVCIDIILLEDSKIIPIDTFNFGSSTTRNLS